MQNPFVESPNLRITQIFSKSVSHFRTQNTIMILYAFGKILASLILTILSLSQQCGWTLIEYWLVLVGVQSFVNLWCYLAIQKIMMDLHTIVRIAEDLHQTVLIPMDENVFIPLNEEDLIDYGPQAQLNQQEENKKVSILSMQIKFEASKKNAYLKYFGQIAFIFNQALIILGFVLEFTLPQATLGAQASECRGPTLIFMFVFLILSIYQYIDLYVIVLLILICLPFILIFLAYQMIKNYQQKRKNESFALKLEKCAKKYIPGLVQGDAECRICMSNYNLNENIIVLPCNTLHHFHSTCILAWLKVSSSCPLCRSNFSGDDDQLQQQLINHEL